MELNADEALFCLEGIACGSSESWTPQVGPTRSPLRGAPAEDLVRRLARCAGVDEDEALAAISVGYQP